MESFAPCIVFVRIFDNSHKKNEDFSSFFLFEDVISFFLIIVCGTFLQILQNLQRNFASQLIHTRCLSVGHMNFEQHLVAVLHDPQVQHSFSLLTRVVFSSFKIIKIINQRFLFINRFN